MAVAPLAAAISASTALLWPCRKINRVPSAAKSRLKASRLWCNHHRLAPPRFHIPGAVSSRIYSGITGWPVSAAAVSAGWSATRKSWRNQTMMGDEAIATRSKGEGVVVTHAATSPIFHVASGERMRLYVNTEPVPGSALDSACTAMAQTTSWLEPALRCSPPRVLCCQFSFSLPAPEYRRDLA